MMIEQLSAFVTRVSYDDLSAKAQRQIKVSVLDSLACAVGAMAFEPMHGLRRQIEQFGGRPLATMIGGAKTSPDRAAFYNIALTQHLGFNDALLLRDGFCQPSDCLPAILAASEYAGASGREFLTALAVAYQVQWRLCEALSARMEGLLHGTPGSYAVAAGVAKALRLDQEQTAKAISRVAARPVRQEEWPFQYGAKLYSESPSSVYQAVLLAISSIAGDSEAVEARKEIIAIGALDSEIDWGKEDVEAVRRIMTKKFNAAIHSQSALEAVMHLRERQPSNPNQIERIEVDTFDVAYDLLGRYAKGNEYHVRSKWDAYRSLPYLLAVALLDGEVSPSQLEQGRILREDVQSLMQKVVVRPSIDFSSRFPKEMPARVRIFLRDGQTLTRERHDYEGFTTRPLRWERAIQKFTSLAMFQLDYESGQRIMEKILDLEEIDVRELTELLAGIDRTIQQKNQEQEFALRRYKLAA